MNVFYSGLLMTYLMFQRANKFPPKPSTWFKELWICSTSFPLYLSLSLFIFLSVCLSNSILKNNTLKKRREDYAPPPLLTSTEIKIIPDLQRTEGDHAPVPPDPARIHGSDPHPGAPLPLHVQV